MDFTRITEDEANNKKIQLFREDMVRSDFWYIKKGVENWEVEWNSGNLTEKSENLEFFHFHFINSKSKASFKIKKWYENRFFLMTEKGISYPD